MRMMSRAAIAVVLTLIAAPLHAQTSFGVSAGASVPVGTTADGFDVGYNLTASFGIKPPLAPIGVRIDGMLNSMDGKESGTLRTLAGTINATLSAPLMPIPMGYLIGGLGMYNNDGGGSSSTDLGFNIGAGLNFPLTGFATFLEARFHYVDGDGGSMKFIPITFGMRF